MKIKVENPCNEDWSKMTKAEQGRFCDSCQKTVTDFSEMSLEEIKETLRNSSGRICGRIKNSQLSEINGEYKDLPNAFNIKKWTIAAALAGVIAYPNYTSAIDMTKDIASISSVYNPISSNEEITEKKSPVKDSVTISGIVKDSKGNIMAGAVMYCSNIRTSTISDEKGYFEIKVPKKDSSINITASYPSYMQQNHVSVNCLKARKNIEILMHYFDRNMTMGGMTTYHDPTPLNIKLNIKQVVKDTVEKVKRIVKPK
jgi:hypothetical protein